MARTTLDPLDIENIGDFEDAQGGKLASVLNPVTAKVQSRKATGNQDAISFDINAGVTPKVSSSNKGADEQSTPERGGTQDAVDRAKAQSSANFGRGFGIGTSLSQPTGEEDFFSAGNLAQIGTATALGAATAGPAGAVTALVTSGLGAYLNSKTEGRRAKAYKKAQENATRMHKESVARDEKWKTLNRADALSRDKFNRNQTNLQNDWSVWQNMNTNLGNMVNKSKSLIDRNVELGR